MNIIDQLTASVREAAEYNQNTQAAPAAILWADKEKQWEKAIPAIRQRMPELLVLGDYSPEHKTGPAIWIKCAIAGTLADTELPADNVPVIYLPGVSRLDLRAIESCPEYLQPLAELQYRGVFWSQLNGKDWTIYAWLKTSNGGLGLDIAKDAHTLAALQRALPHILNADQQVLENKRVEATDVNQLLTIDAVKDLLVWMNDPEGTRKCWDDARWHAFEELIEKDYGFDIAKEGELGAAEKLTEKSGCWVKAWHRFEESWQHYPTLVELLEKVPPRSDMFADLSGYPSYNQEQEQDLRNSLIKLETLSPKEARAEIHRLEAKHGIRRSWLWSAMNKAPLANALKHLTVLAEKTTRQLGGMDLETMAAAYKTGAWQADQAAMSALATKGSANDNDAIVISLKAIYTPWLSDSAEHFQQLVSQKGYEQTKGVTVLSGDYQMGSECIFFVDGLRYDAAKQLEGALLRRALNVKLDTRWTALPTVTSTAKASVTPVTEAITGRTTDKDFVPSLVEKNTPWSQHYLKKSLAEKGWQFLSPNETGNSKGLAWLETGDLDHYGHEHGLKLARSLNQILEEVEERVIELLSAGWQKIRIVTDHGWLLVPGGLPKASLPKYLTETRWGRCALLKENVSTDELTVGWHWNSSVSIAMAPGITSFIGGKVYDHGGLSLQECLTPILSVTPGQQLASVSASISSLKWIGLRCKIDIQTEDTNLQAQLRRNAALADSAITDLKPVKNGKVTLFVEDEDLEGEAAVLVLINAQGNLITKKPTFIGGE